VWIGAKAIILSGNNIGSGSVIGAGAIVTHDIQENTVNVGAPARVIKER
jgi:maltose O-acetyltransferase